MHEWQMVLPGLLAYDRSSRGGATIFCSLSDTAAAVDGFSSEAVATACARDETAAATLTCGALVSTAVRSVAETRPAAPRPAAAKPRRMLWMTDGDPRRRRRGVTTKPEKAESTAEVSRAFVAIRHHLLHGGVRQCLVASGTLSPAGATRSRHCCEAAPRPSRRLHPSWQQRRKLQARRRQCRQLWRLNQLC